MLLIDAPYVPNRSDYDIVPGVLGVGYFIHEKHTYYWGETIVALSSDDAENIIKSLIRKERERVENAQRLGMMY